MYFLAIILDVAKIILVFSLSANYYYADIKHKDETLKLLLGVAVPIFFELSKRITEKKEVKMIVEPEPKRKKEK